MAKMPFPMQKLFLLLLNRLLTCLPQLIMFTLPCFRRWPVGNITKILMALFLSIFDFFQCQKFSLLIMNALQIFNYAFRFSLLVYFFLIAIELARTDGV